MINKETYINNIPQELKDCKQWLWFKIYHNKDKKDNAKAVKIPISQSLVKQMNGTKKRTGQILKLP